MMITAGALAAAQPAPAKPVRARRAPAPVVKPETKVEVVPAKGSMMTPEAVKLRPTTPEEAEANAVWSTRAALNIAALQCQFSPFLATVRNYNDFLRQHADELDRARTTMIAHFKRYDATQAQNSFDRYTTQTYNSYSTLDAQYAFCDAAGLAGRQVLTVVKGKLGRSAGALRDSLRLSLIPIAGSAFLDTAPLEPAVDLKLTDS